jgi:hypothetical protein
VTPETSNEPAVTDEQPFGADEHRLTVDEVLEQLELELILSPETEFDQEPAADTESYAAAEQEEPVTELKQSPQTRSRS